ncbi:diguanylate cyclase [Paraburkholderia sp. B3]|uniref:sensor domain-containing diguanylate cyclase n=1 Tax=Paraburkholderia sp. B3 TaxID=3134791 RepID=UPI003981A831
MPKRVLALRHRARRWWLARGRQAIWLIGGHPLFGGMSGSLVATVMAGVTLAAIYSGRSEELSHAAENSRNIVRIVSSDIARNVEIYNLALQAVVTGAQQPQTWTLPEALRQQVLFNRATAASSLGGAYVVGADGYVAASQSGGAATGVLFADRDYFLAQASRPDTGLFFSKPYFSRLRGGVPTIALSRRINGREGEFAGVALLAVRLEYFQHLLERIDVGRHGRVFIMMQDGTMLASKPPAQRGMGTSYADSPNYAIISRRPSGTYTGRSPLDGRMHIFTWEHIDNAPLIVGIAPAVDDVLLPWRRRAWFAIAMTTLFGGAWIIVSWALAFALRDKVIAEGELMRLAVTDPLTGLANRRALDSRLAAEWQRAVREHEPLSVLFFDIDHFKIFNDTYGHAAGDEVLALVAGRIAAGARRTSDMAARYGGEEFAVVLPGTALESAVKIAEKIRRRIESANLAHSGSHYGRVTVSVGCTSCDPPQGGSAVKLLAAADRLLYEAKAGGRNQVKARPWSGEGVEPANTGPQAAA